MTKSFSAAADDYEVKRTIWESKVPVEFRIDSDCATLGQQQSAFMMLPRVSYFSFHLTKAKLNNLISNFDDNAVDDIWLQFNGQTLKWHYAIGILYDMYCNEELSLPWLITLKVKEFPDDLIRCRVKHTMKNCFFQAIKEADYLKHKSGVVNQMTANDHSKLFEALANDRFDDFWNVNKRLMIDDDKEKLLHVPIRLYEPGFSFRQFLISPRKPNNLSCDDSTEAKEELDVLLRDVLLEAFPENVDAIQKDGGSYVAISHGITLPLDTPILWLAKNLSYPDNFVHIVWRKKF